jgi:integrase/recombinase XerC
MPDPSPKPKRKSRPAAESPEAWDKTVNRFTSHLRTKGASDYTLEYYGADLVRFRAWFRENRKGEELIPRNITSVDLRDFQDHLASSKIAKGPRTGDLVKPATVNRTISALKSFLDWSVRMGLSEPLVDPPENLSLGERPIKSLDERQQKSLLRALERNGDTKAMAIVQVLIHTGLRVAELCSLTWGDVDTTRGSAMVYVRAGKGRKPREEELDSTARKYFKVLRDLITHELGPGHGGRGDPVLISQRPKGEGRPLGIQGVQKLLAPYAAAAGVKTLTPHMLRHTFATNHVRAKTPGTAIQEWMGHSRYETTAKYMKLGPQDRRRAMEQFDQGDED